MIVEVSSILQQAVSRLNLPEETKSKIITYVTDPPPTGRNKTINDMLAAREISAGLSEEDQLTKAIRIAIYAAVYDPGRFITYRNFVQWVNKEKNLKEDSPSIALFRKKMRKLSDSIASLDLRCVGLTLQRATSDTTTVNGFRLTVSGDDYVSNVVTKTHKRVGRGLSLMARDLAEDRIRTEDVKDPVLKTFVKRDKDRLEEMRQDNVLIHFSAPIVHLLGPGRTQKA